MSFRTALATVILTAAASVALVGTAAADDPADDLGYAPDHTVSGSWNSAATFGDMLQD